MRIAVIGCGAMGALYGGYLSRNNNVTLVERNPDRIAKIRADGLRIAEPDGSAASLCIDLTNRITRSAEIPI